MTRFTAELESGAPDLVGLRRLLKTLGRVHGIRCVSVKESVVEDGCAEPDCDWFPPRTHSSQPDGGESNQLSNAAARAAIPDCSHAGHVPRAEDGTGAST